MTGLHFLDPNPGGGEPVLLLHGLGADGSSWRLQFPSLIKKGYRPIAPDAPGFGASAYDGHGWTPKRVAAQLAELLAGLDAGPAHVVGLSLGGVLAQQFAHDFPDLARKLILVSTFAALQPESLDGWWYFLRRGVAVLTRGPQEQAQLVAERVFPEARDAVLREMLVQSIQQADPRAYRKAMRALVRFDSRRWLAGLSRPTLVISGELDTTVSPQRQELLRRGIPGAAQVIVPGAGHAVPVDQPEVFNRLLLEFLAR